MFWNLKINKACTALVSFLIICFKSWWQLRPNLIVSRDSISKKVVPSFHVCTRSYPKKVYFFRSYLPLLSFGDTEYLPTKSKKVKKN